MCISIIERTLCVCVECFTFIKDLMICYVFSLECAFAHYHLLMCWHI